MSKKGDTYLVHVLVSKPSPQQKNGDMYQVRVPALTL